MKICHALRIIMQPCNIFILDKNPVHRNMIRYRLISEGFRQVSVLPSVAEFNYQVEKGCFPNFLIVDCQSIIPGQISFVEMVLKASPDTKIILFTDIEDQNFANELLENGATDYILKNGANLQGLKELILNLKYMSPVNQFVRL